MTSFKVNIKFKFKRNCIWWLSNYNGGIKKKIHERKRENLAKSAAKYRQPDKMIHDF